jgi:hypothetical protein
LKNYSDNDSEFDFFTPAFKKDLDKFKMTQNKQIKHKLKDIQQNACKIKRDFNDISLNFCDFRNEDQM